MASSMAVKTTERLGASIKQWIIHQGTISTALFTEAQKANYGHDPIREVGAIHFIFERYLSVVQSIFSCS